MPAGAPISSSNAGFGASTGSFHGTAVSVTATNGGMVCIGGLPSASRRLRRLHTGHSGEPQRFRLRHRFKDPPCFALPIAAVLIKLDQLAAQ